MTVNPVFGRIFIPQIVEQATKALLIEWFPTYLRAIEDQEGYATGSIKVPKEANYKNRNKFDVLTLDDIPLVTVISPGIMGSPKKDGQHKYQAVYRLGIGVATAATTEEAAKLNCDAYGAAVREIMLKHAGGALGARIEWLDEQFVDLPIVDQLHQYRAAALYFSVDVQNVATARGGPIAPNAEPYVQHTADSVDITLNKE